jgi:hypothetical protein
MSHELANTARLIHSDDPLLFHSFKSPSVISLLLHVSVISNYTFRGYFQVKGRLYVLLNIQYSGKYLSYSLIGQMNLLSSYNSSLNGKK